MRKGARSRAEIAPDILEGLNAGTIETASLPECLAVDFAALMAACFPGVDCTELHAAAADGITRRMAVAAQLAAGRDMTAHPSDTVRGWACYAIGQRDDPLPALVEAIRPLADDPHFGVREWAWLALRPRIVADIPQALALLAPWTASPSANLRRFASEATRPRGVWCRHAAALRADPAPGLAVLEPLKADPDRYVQNSVANWLNDAAKDHPDWVRATCARWSEECDGKATAYIVKRACRSL
jgi:3-methyladenine DNA glycosylase AlkC